MLGTVRTAGRVLTSVRSVADGVESP